MAQSISQEAIAVTGQVGAQAASRYAGATISGAPTTGSFLLGDHVIDQTGQFWFCVAAGNPGSWISTTTLSYDQIVASYNPNAWWKLNDNNPQYGYLGGAADSSGNGFGGSISGTGTTFGVAGPIIGSPSNTAVTVTGASYIATNYSPQSITSFSVSAWYKTTNSATITIFDNGALTSIYQGISLVLSAGVLTVFFGTSSTLNVNITDTVATNDNNWHFATATWNGSTLSLYRDGVLRSTYSVAGTMNAKYNSIIGAYNYGSGGIGAYFIGSISEVTTYTTALTAAQITALYYSINRPLTTPAQQATLPITENVAGKNFIINGGMDIWQRATSATYSIAGYLTADRWYVYSGGPIITPSQVTVASGLPNGFQYAMRQQRASGQTSTGTLYLTQSLETKNSLPLAGQTVTLSFWARCGSGFTSPSQTITAQLIGGTGTDQNVINGYTNPSYPVNTIVYLTQSWQRFSYTGTYASSITEAALNFFWSGVGTAGAADYFDITGVQLEIGPSATPFSRAGGSIGGELALCQRYYYQVTGSNGSGGIAIDIAVGQVLASNQIDFLWQFPITMRTTPSISASSGSNYFLAYTYSGLYYVNTISASYDQSIYSTRLRLATSGATGGQGAILGTGNALAYLAASAEL